jgi:hypothetical protein
MRRRIPRTKGALTGFLIIALGVWAGLVAFVGPYFDFQIGTTDTWDWSSNRFFLEVLPAAAAVLGGLMLVSAVTRASASFGGWLALAAGIWLVIGPTMSMLWESGNLGTGAAIGDTGTRVGEWIGFFYGPGALIAALAAFALGRFMAPAVVPAAEPAAAPAATTDEPQRGTYRRRLRPFRRTRDQREVESTTPRR